MLYDTNNNWVFVRSKCGSTLVASTIVSFVTRVHVESVLSGGTVAPCFKNVGRIISEYVDREINNEFFMLTSC